MTVIINEQTGEVADAMTEAEARDITSSARSEFKSAADHFDKGWALVEQAVKGGAHLALGYRSAGDYLHHEFDGVLSNLDISARRVVVRELSQTYGLSTRAIAPVVGVSKSQVAEDCRQVSSTGHLDAPDAPDHFEDDDSHYGGDEDFITDQADLDAATHEPPAEAGPTANDAGEAEHGEAVERASVPSPAPARPVTGIDGKTYTRPAPAAPKPKRTPLPDSIRNAVIGAETKLTTLRDLTRDDRWSRNAEEVAPRLRNDLRRLSALLEQVTNALPTSTEQDSDV